MWWWWSATFKLPPDMLNTTTFSVHRVTCLTENIPTQWQCLSLVLAMDWQLGKCGCSLYSPIICTTDFDKFLFQKRGSYYLLSPSQQTVRRSTWQHRAQEKVLCRDRAPTLAGIRRYTASPLVSVTGPCFPTFLSHHYRRLFFRLVIASHTARKEIFLCNKNSFGVFYSLLIHAKQESMTHCLLWLQKIQTKVLNVLRQL